MKAHALIPARLRERYHNRVQQLRKAGYVVPSGQAEAPAGDTIEVVRVVDGRGWGQEGGLLVRASTQFVEAYRLAQDSAAIELLPAQRLFRPDGR